MRSEEFITETQLDEVNWRKALATGVVAAATATGAMAQDTTTPRIDIAKIQQQEKEEQRKINALPKPTTPEELKKYLRQIERIRNGFA